MSRERNTPLDDVGDASDGSASMAGYPTPDNDRERDPHDGPVPPRPQRADHSTSGDQLDLVTTLGHELASLLDGSMRSLSLAMTALERNGREAATFDIACRRLGTVERTLERMAEIVTTAMSTAALPLGSPLHLRGRPASVGECLEHAAEVVGPRAEHLGIELDVDADAASQTQPSGALYAAILNGVRNAIDSIEAAGGDGRITLTARADARLGEPWTIIEVVDDGFGLPDGLEPHRLFDHGVSGRAGHTGIGLALAKQIVLDMGGMIALAEAGGMPPRQGAILRIECPVPALDQPIGQDRTPPDSER